MKRRRRLVSACLAVLTAACTAPQPVRTPDEAAIYVIGRGWHTDIGLPVDEIAGPLTALEANFIGVRYLTFGFGERRFLVNRKKNVATMLRALMPSQSALLITALKASPQAAFGQQNVIVLQVTRAGLERIEARIWHEFGPSLTGKPVPLADGPYPGSVFYAARDTYSGLYTCNTWTAQTLRDGGLPMPLTLVLFASQVTGMARWIGARQDSSPAN